MKNKNADVKNCCVGKELKETYSTDLSMCSWQHLTLKAQKRKRLSFASVFTENIGAQMTTLVGH